ncbi:MAG: hypothetical protein WA418_37820 [Bradyrhizobium sp.]
MQRFIVAVVLGMAIPALAEAQGNANIRGPADDPTPRVRILEPKDGAALRKDREFQVRIETENYDFAYDHATTPGGAERLPDRYNQVAQRPNSGHVHIYIASVGPKGEYKAFNMPQNFMMPQRFENKNSGTIAMPGLPAGKYKLLVELVADDHTPRVKHHPRDWPSLDMIDITVR